MEYFNWNHFGMKTHFIINCFQQRYTCKYHDRKTFAFKQLYVFTLHDCLSEKSLQGWMEKLDVFWMLFIKTFSTYSRSQNFLLLNIFNLTTMICTEFTGFLVWVVKGLEKYCWSLKKMRNWFWYSHFSKSSCTVHCNKRALFAIFFFNRG